jgi:hypothetical protein
VRLLCTQREALTPGRGRPLFPVVRGFCAQEISRESRLEVHVKRGLPLDEIGGADDHLGGDLQAIHRQTPAPSEVSLRVQLGEQLENLGPQNLGGK